MVLDYTDTEVSRPMVEIGQTSRITFYTLQIRAKFKVKLAPASVTCEICRSLQVSGGGMSGQEHSTVMSREESFECLKSSRLVECRESQITSS